MKFLFVIFTTLIFTASCKKTEKRQSELADSTEVSTENKVEVNCDTIYRDKGYKITIQNLDAESEDDTKPNILFTFLQVVNGEPYTILSDSIYNRVPDIRFEDFNGDGVKDVLIQNISDVRSNNTYHLYLVDTINNQLKKIKGFEDIKNPRYVPEYDLVDNYVISGRIWTSFYKISADTVYDLDIIIYDDQLDDDTYNKNYQNAIKKIFPR